MKLLQITGYKLKIIFNDRFFTIAVLLIGIIICIAAGFAAKNQKYGSVPVAFVDGDMSQYSNELVNSLKEQKVLKVYTVNIDKALEMIKNKEIEEIFIIKQDFEERIISGDNEGIIDIIKSPSSFSAEFVNEIVAGEVIKFTTANKAADWVVKQYRKIGLEASTKLYSEAVNITLDQLRRQPLDMVQYIELDPEGKEVDWKKSSSSKELDSTRSKLSNMKKDIPSVTVAATGVLAAFIFFFVLFSSSWIVEEKRNGTFSRFLVAPNGMLLAFVSNLLALLVASTIVTGIFLIINGVICGEPLVKSFKEYLLLLVYLLVIVSISMLISGLFRTQEQLQSFAPPFALITAFIGGCFWNFGEISNSIKKLSLITPQGWLLRGLEGTQFYLYFGALAIFALILVPLSYIIINKQTAHA